MRNVFNRHLEPIPSNLHDEFPHRRVLKHTEYRKYLYSVVVGLYQKYRTRLGELNFRALARKLSFLLPKLDIFDIRQHYIRIPFFFQRFVC